MDPVSTPKPASNRTVADEELVKLMNRVARGDEQALAQIYDATCRFVYGLVLRITGDAAAADELSLEVYMQVWRTAQGYTPERGRVLAWLVTMARSRAIDWLRSRTARAAQKQDPIDDAARLHSADAGPETACLEVERTRAVRAAMEQLPAEQRTALELAYYHGLSHSEIAAKSGLPLGTVKARIRLGMLHMKDSLCAFAEAV